MSNTMMMGDNPSQNTFSKNWVGHFLHRPIFFSWCKLHQRKRIVSHRLPTLLVVAELRTITISSPSQKGPHFTHTSDKFLRIHNVLGPVIRASCTVPVSFTSILDPFVNLSRSRIKLASKSIKKNTLWMKWWEMRDFENCSVETYFLSKREKNKP